MATGGKVHSNIREEKVAFQSNNALCKKRWIERYGKSNINPKEEKIDKRPETKRKMQSNGINDKKEGWRE
jgi:hypothetical protein